MKYEYKIVQLDTSGYYGGGTVDEKKLLKKLHSLADQDWELITTLPLTQSSMMTRMSSTNEVLLIFKRPMKKIVKKKVKKKTARK